MGSGKIALIDLDGTIANYDGAMKRELALMAAPGEPTDYEHSNNPAWIEARRRSASRVPGFWRNLEKLNDGFEILAMVKEIGFEVHILTKGPSTKSLAWAEKVEWVREHVPGVNITITEDKSLVYGRVLVDDWTPYFGAWLDTRPRGLVIVPPQPWNTDATEVSPRVVRYVSGHPRPEEAHTFLALKAAYDRKNGEPLTMPVYR